MKQPDTTSLLADDSSCLTPQAQLLVQDAAAYGIDIIENQASSLVTFLDLVLEKNKVINLTAIRDPNDGLVLHLLDSLLFLKGFEDYVPLPSDSGSEEHISLLDMGCGAGFPGIPLALVRESLNALLCDSVKKKIAVVDEFISQLGIESRVSTSTERVETLPRHYRDHFDLITARALAPLSVLLEYAAPLLKKGGRLIVSKGLPHEDELSSAQQVAQLTGFRELSREEYELPRDLGHRTLCVYVKMRPASVSLPRQVGFALKHPLA